MESIDAGTRACNPDSLTPTRVSLDEEIRAFHYFTANVDWWHFEAKHIFHLTSLKVIYYFRLTAHIIIMHFLYLVLEGACDSNYW